MAGDSGPSPWRRAFRVGLLSFALAGLVSYASDLTLARVPMLVAFIVVLALVFIGICFDVVGTSVTAAELSPLNAMAAKKVSGAKQAIWLVRNADRVANFCNDVVGDVTGAVTGAAGTTVALAITRATGAGAGANQVLTLLVIGLIAGLTVGGKAYGKSIAVSQATQVVTLAGRVIAGCEQILGRPLLGGRQSNSSRRRTT